MKENNIKEYGGYLPFEFHFLKGEFYKKNKLYTPIKLNCGRATFFYAAKFSNLKKIFLPFFTCKETKIPFLKLGIKVQYYLLDDQLLPKDVTPKDDEYMFWTNYYGNATESQIKKISKKYKNLIIDNCHAFFSKPIKNAYNCYSTRKFFGVPDGAYLIKNGINFKGNIERDISYNNCDQLIKQLDKGVNFGYNDSLKNEERLCDQFKLMSNLTTRILESLDYKKIIKKRRENFLFLHSLLKKSNLFPINLKSNTHMYYPFLFKNDKLRYKLIKEKIYNPFWWEHVLEIVPKSSIEYQLSKYTIMLPIDQRYNKKDIENIANIVLKNIY